MSNWRSPVRAGDLRDRISIRRESNVKTATGGLTRTWTDLVTALPAQVTSLNGRESVVGQVLQGISQFQIVVRYRTDVKVSDQIKWNGRELNVHSAEDRDGRRVWTYIQASTEAPQGA
jgi:SPP1 family predicted phage head-tail adaptor